MHCQDFLQTNKTGITDTRYRVQYVDSATFERDMFCHTCKEAADCVCKKAMAIIANTRKPK